MTLCQECAEKHGATVRFAEVIIDAELNGRRKSQTSEDLRAMLPPVPVPVPVEQRADLETGDTDGYREEWRP